MLPPTMLIISLVRQTYIQHFAKRMAYRLRAPLSDVHRGARKAPAAILDALPDLSMTRDGAFTGRLLVKGENL
jgi:DNA-binding transcriptional regulator YbjK